jgi:hypothetical protein
MATSKKLTQAQWHEPAEKIDWRALLSPEDLQNLAGFFDVLIEMDFEQRKQGEENGSTKK